MAAGMVGVVRVWVLWWCGCWWSSGARLQGWEVARLGGCKVASMATIKGCFYACFVVVYYCGVGVFLYYWHGVPFRGAGWVCRWGVSVGVLVGVVVPVVGRGWQAIPLPSSV